MAKPAYGTLVASNSLTTDMRCAYLLNGSDINALVNSVGGAEPLAVFGGGMSYDSGTESLAFTGSGFLQIPTAELAEFDGIAAATIMIGYKSSSSFVALCAFGAAGFGQGSYIPYNDGNIYTGELVTSRYSFATPSGITFSNFNTLAITGAGGGNVLFYLDGSLKHTQTAASTVSCGASGHIGHNVDGYELTGNVQFFYAWKRVLSASELATLASDPYGPIFTGAPARKRRPIVFVIT